MASAGEDRAKLVAELLGTMQDGRVKLYVTSEVLRLRRKVPGLFTTGEYVPLQASGARAENVFAFERRLGDRRAVVVVPRLITKLVSGDGGLPVGGAWGDTLVPTSAGGRLRNVFTGSARTVEVDVPVADLLSDFPVGLWLT